MRMRRNLAINRLLAERLGLQALDRSEQTVLDRLGRLASELVPESVPELVPESVPELASELVPESVPESVSLWRANPEQRSSLREL